MRIRPRDEMTEAHDRLTVLDPTLPDGALDELVAWVGQRRRRRAAMVAALDSYVREAPGIETLAVAEALLPQLDESARLEALRELVRTARPELVLPWVPELEALVAAHRPARIRTLVDDLLGRTDPAGVDLDVLANACFVTDVAYDLRRVTAYVVEHGDRATTSADSRHPRLAGLVELLDRGTEAVAELLAGWTTTPDDALFAFRAALTLKCVPALLALADHIDPSHLTTPELSRAAVQLWRAGANDRGLALARAVPQGFTAAFRRAQTVIGEFESFALMDSGWQLPASRTEPAYEPRTGSVLHVLHNSLPYRRTGAANRTQGLLSGLAADGYTITGVTPPGFPYDDVPAPDRASIVERHEIHGVVYQHLLNDGVVTPRFPVQDFIATYSAGILEHARRESAALIHAASNSYNALAGLTAARVLGVPAIYEVRGLYEEVRRSRHEEYAETQQYRFAAYLETLAATEADRVIAITPGLRDTLVDRGVPAERITVVPNGVDTRRFQPLPRDEELARRYGLEDKIVIGYLGSLNWYEGHELLFEAFARLHATHPDVRLLVVGGGSHLNMLLRLRASLRLEDEILMPGSVPFEQVEAHYSIVDIAPITRLSSPVTETVSPLKPFEAMAMGKTVISSNVTIMTEIIDDGRTGLLFAKGDADSLELGLRRLVEDRELRERLGASAREWVVAERDWRTLAGQVAQVYRDLGVEPTGS